MQQESLQNVLQTTMTLLLGSVNLDIACNNQPDWWKADRNSFIFSYSYWSIIPNPSHGAFSTNPHHTAFCYTLSCMNILQKSLRQKEWLLGSWCAGLTACQTSVCQLEFCPRLPTRPKNISVALKCKYQSITRLHLMGRLKQNLSKPFKCHPICLEMRWKNIKGEHWCFKHRLLVITEEWAESLPTVGHFISEQIYREQSIFARVNHFCTAYMCVTGALHACNDKVTWRGCWLHGLGGYVCVCV